MINKKLTKGDQLEHNALQLNLALKRSSKEFCQNIYELIKDGEIGLDEFCKQANISRAGLYKSFGENTSQPKLQTMLDVLNALDLRLKVNWIAKV